MNVSDIIVYIILGFMVIGAADKIMGNKYGYGKKFDEGFMAMGSLAIAMIGVISLAPVLADTLRPVVVPVYTFLGADPAMFATTLLANDMGGYPLAMELALTHEAGLFAGLILGAMMGPTIVFTIPVALGIIKKEDHPFLAKGILAGIITIPLGCLAGGLAAGFSLGMILSNLVPIIIVSLLIALGMWKVSEKMIRGFVVFGKSVVIVTTGATAAIVFETLTGIVIIPGMAPVWDGVKIIGAVAIILIGAFPMVHFITTTFKKELMRMGNAIGMGDVAAAGMVATLANNIPMFVMMKDMDDRGKVMNVAFAVSAAFIFGGSLGFTAGVYRDMVFPMVVGKAVGGFTAVMLAHYITKNMILELSTNEKQPSTKAYL